MSAGPEEDRPVKVLLIEDNSADATLVREYLKEAQPGKFQLTKAKRMSDALEKLRLEAFDVILLDLSLPDCTGIETFDRLAKPARDTPIVVLTGLDDTTTEKQLVAQGAHDYLRKRHLDPKILAAVLVQAVRQS
jgi:two-component system sensor histidine kinase UhpB